MDSDSKLKNVDSYTSVNNPLKPSHAIDLFSSYIIYKPTSCWSFIYSLQNTVKLSGTNKQTNTIVIIVSVVGERSVKTSPGR